jgi:hypothetical protein
MTKRLTAVYGVIFLLAVLLSLMPAEGEEPEHELTIRGIQDNSFLIEEAYNQDEGVVQNIQNFVHYRGKTWMYTFTQEWPVLSHTHQLSYTIPFLRGSDSGNRAGLGDILINYRYQLIDKGSFAMAPRLSLILPTGDYRRGTGSDAVGLQADIPASIEIGDRWATHWNAGFTCIPNAKEPQGATADTWGYNLGGSVIFGMTRNAQVFLETIWNSNETVQPDGSTQWSNAFYLSPGARFAINFKSGLQIVPGIAVPIGIGPSAGDVGIFAYFSLEFPFMKVGKEKKEG